MSAAGVTEALIVAQPLSRRATLTVRSITIDGEKRKPDDVEGLGWRLTLHELNLPSLHWRPIVMTTHLVVLNLTTGGLNELPSSIGNLVNLQRLRVYDNNLKYLPKEIQSLKRLQILSAFGNQLQTLPRILDTLKHLKILRLGGNPALTDRDLDNSGLWKLPSLQELYLIQNPQIGHPSFRKAIAMDLQVLELHPERI